jgi:hypothetical protein
MLQPRLFRSVSWARLTREVLESKRTLSNTRRCRRHGKKPVTNRGQWVSVLLIYNFYLAFTARTRRAQRRNNYSLTDHFRYALHTGKSRSAQNLSVSVRRHQRRGDQRMGTLGTAHHAQEICARGTENISEQGRVHGRLHQLTVRKQLRSELENTCRQRRAH